MKLTPSATLIVVLLFTLTAWPQGTNPPYLAQFPTPERVKSVLTGKDAMDTAAKHVGAFWQLRKIVEQMASFRLYRNQLTPDEGRMIGLYNLGYQTSGQAYAKHPDRAAWFNAHSFYEQSDDLREEIFAKLLSPQIRAQWAQIEGNTKTTTATNRAAREKAANEEGVFKIDRGQTPASRTSGPSSDPGVAVGPADPSIAKAAASKVDTKVVGLQLGDPVVLPECNILGFDTVISPGGQNYAQRTCIDPSLRAYKGLGDMNILGIQTDTSTIANVEIVKLTKDNCPAWVLECKAYATLHNGRLAAVALYTSGRGAERTVTADLRAKYGAPIGVSRSTITPESGNDFVINEPNWLLPGLRVEYQVVLRDEIEDRVTITKGLVRIETESAYQRRMDAKKNVKRKL